jgi:branched-chain amino acid transport system ATP-binding protein
MTVTNTDTTAAERGERRDAEVRLRVAGLAAGYHKVPVVRDLDMEVRAGEIVALVGANGAGKTTTLLTIAGVLPPQSGMIEVLSRGDKAPLHRRARRGLGYVTEQRAIISSLTTEENLRLGRGSTEDALGYVPELERLLKRKAGLLSGGEQQMLVLARQLAANPKLLLADEMSLGLAPLIVRRLLDIIRRAADEKGLAVLIVEQQVRNVLTTSDYGYVLRRGQLVMEGTGSFLASRMAEVEGHYLAAAG